MIPPGFIAQLEAEQKEKLDWEAALKKPMRDKKKKEWEKLVDLNKFTVLFNRLIVTPYKEELDKKAFSQIQISMQPEPFNDRLSIWTAEYARDEFAPRPLRPRDLDRLFPFAVDNQQKKQYQRYLAVAKQINHAVLAKIDDSNILFSPKGCCLSVLGKINSGGYKKIHKVIEIVPPGTHPPARYYVLSESIWNLDNVDETLVSTSSREEYYQNILKGRDVTNYYLSWRYLKNYEKEIKQGTKKKITCLREITIMEYAEHRSVETIMKQNHWASVFQAKNLGIEKIIRTSCEVLAKMHNRQLLHRDINPRNMVVCHDKEKDEPLVKWIDFGTVCRCDDMVLRTQWKTTCVYLSPELAAEGYILMNQGIHPEKIDSDFYVAPQNEKLDVWSLGMSILEISYGSDLKFLELMGISSYKIKEVLKGILRFSPEQAVTGLGSLVDDKIKEILRFTLIADPALRPTAKELLDKVKEIYEKDKKAKAEVEDTAIIS